ncbi:MAG TPA: cytidylate kinase, partial [Nitrospirae bacterium]|nr:cytidylate kinase [Nitrospirota bacterium]
GKVVIEGRDIGTAVFPEADNKFYLDAGPEKRAGRRYKELQEKGINTTLESILKGIIKRDDRDSNRENAPLTRTDSMVYIDTSNISADEVVNEIMEALKTS